MLIFQTIKFKNFLSTGNAWNAYALNAHPHTLITGINGSGKTSMLDALCFVLYGKPFRNIVKGGVINSINAKNLVVEVEFTTQNNQYMIRRGMKPNVFDVVCNGQPLPAFPSTGEMQSYLEKYVLKCNYKSFINVVILGASSYVPFMRLTPAARREIVEDILDVEVFSLMQSLVKERLVATKESLTKAQGIVAVAASRHALAKTYAEQWTHQQEEKRARLATELANTASRLANLTIQRNAVVEPEAGWIATVAKLPEWQEKNTKATKLVARFNSERQHLTHSHTFFKDHDQCPMCQQKIEGPFKTEQLATAEEALAKVNADYEEAQKLSVLMAKRLDVARDAQRRLQILEVTRKQQDEQIKAAEQEQARLTLEHQHTFDAPPAPPTELGDLDAANQEVADLTYLKQVQEQSNTLLKDTGIRTRIVQQYLPMINKQVNAYLQALNFPIQFTLDETFTETIKSRYRDEFSYENFSEGEKKRIDLALVLTWRAVALAKNSIATNLLIFDEIFDGSLDSPGTDDFLVLLQALGADTNAFIISHKDQLVDKFSANVLVEKVRGFTVVSPA